MKLSEIIMKNAPKRIEVSPTHVANNWYKNIPQLDNVPEAQTVDLVKKVIELENRINNLEGGE